jgi:hypothetical protein
LDSPEDAPAVETGSTSVRRATRAEWFFVTPKTAARIARRFRPVISATDPERSTSTAPRTLCAREPMG